MHKLFNLIILIVLFVVSLSRFSLLTAVWISLAVGIGSFIGYVVLVAIGSVIVYPLIPKLKSNNSAAANSNRAEARKSADSVRVVEPLIAIGIIALLNWASTLARVPIFIEAEIFLTMGMFVVIAWFDRIFTHKKRYTLSACITAAIYFVVALLLFGVIT